MSTLIELREKRANIWSQAQEFNNRAKAGETMSAEDDASWTRALDDVDKITAEIEKRERSEALDSRFAEIDQQTNVVDTRGNDGGSIDEYRETFALYLRNGPARLNARQIDLLAANDFAARAQGVGTGAAGGYAVPQGFWAKVTETLKHYAMVRDIAEVISTDSGNPIPWATNDDTSNVGELLGENVATADLDLTFGQKSLGAYMFTSKNIKASRQFLQDSGVDPESFIAKKAGQRLGRIINQYFTTGTGTAQPLGFVTGATTGVTGATGSTTSVTYDSLVDLQHSVDAAYRESGSCVFVMHDLSLATVRKLKDSQNRPLWEPSLQAGVPSTLLGYPVRINNFMATMAANAKSIAFGDFSAAYVVREVNGGGLLRLEERYAEQLQVGFIAYGRFDGLTQDASAVKLYVNSAT